MLKSMGVTRHCLKSTVSSARPSLGSSRAAPRFFSAGAVGNAKPRGYPYVNTQQPHLSESLLFNTSTNGKAMLRPVSELKIWPSIMSTRLLLLCTTRISLYNFHFSVRLADHFTTLTSFNLKFGTKVRYLSSASCHRKEHADHRSTSSTPKHYCSPPTQRLQSCRPNFRSTITTNHPQS